MKFQAPEREFPQKRRRKSLELVIRHEHAVFMTTAFSLVIAHALKASIYG